MEKRSYSNPFYQISLVLQLILSFLMLSK